MLDGTKTDLLVAAVNKWAEDACDEWTYVASRGTTAQWDYIRDGVLEAAKTVFEAPRSTGIKKQLSEARD